jgi:hypothetical protein
MKGPVSIRAHKHERNDCDRSGRDRRDKHEGNREPASKPDRGYGMSDVQGSSR